MAQEEAVPAAGACPAGWEGSNCDACTTDAVCAASTGDPAATCHTGTDYTRHSVTKAYVCDLSRSPLGALLFNDDIPAPDDVALNPDIEAVAAAVVFGMNLEAA